MDKRFGLLGLGLFSLAFWVLILAVPNSGPVPAADRVESAAAALMGRAVEAVRARRDVSGPPIDPATDINRTGLIGLEASPITTSLGHLEAKRTTTNPAMAAAVVRMMREAGIKRGDAVAVGASSSFPALVVAVLCAAQALEARPIVILSLGASNWGANDPRWTGWHIVSCLNRAGIGARPAALALGGAADRGLDMEEAGRDSLRRTIAASGLPFVEADGLEAVVAARLRVYDRESGGRPVRAFINVGGSWADMGEDPEVLKLKPGFNAAASVSAAPAGRRGVIGAMAARGVPVIHLLYVKGLIDRYGLPWDPMPLPGTGRPPARTGALSGWRAAAAALYLAGMAAGLILILRSRRAYLKR